MDLKLFYIDDVTKCSKLSSILREIQQFVLECTWVLYPHLYNCSLFFTKAVIVTKWSKCQLWKIRKIIGLILSQGLYEWITIKYFSTFVGKISFWVNPELRISPSTCNTPTLPSLNPLKSFDEERKMTQHQNKMSWMPCHMGRLFPNIIPIIMPKYYIY